jgi:hypothetical protein
LDFEDGQPLYLTSTTKYSTVFRHSAVEHIAANSLGTNMEVDTPEDVAGFKKHFNGAVPIKRARMDSITTTSDAAQLRKRKEAEKSYGRGRKILGVYRFPPLCSASSDIDSS